MRLLTRRQFAGLVAISPAVCAVGCSAWQWDDPATAPERLMEDPLPTALERRVLNRLSYGPRPGDVTAIRAQGVDAYIAQQLAPDTIVENPELEALLAECETLDMGPEEIRAVEQEWAYDKVVMPACNALFKFPRPYPRLELQRAANELGRATALRAIYSRRQLLELMVEFWTDHFNIDQSKADCRWLKTVDDDAIRRHALGKFGDLLAVSAKSPAMLVYLDNASNCKYDPVTETPPNENYARELLELHTLGDTSAYTLGDIQEVARCFTGWSVEGEWELNAGRFIFRDKNHDDGEKTVLGNRIPPGQGQADGEMVIGLLARHPLTARTISQKLCRYFVGEEASPALVDQLVDEYLRTEGDVREVLAALFSSDEFRSGASPLLKRPFHFAVSSLRCLGARTSGRELGPHFEAMGQRPFAWAMPDGYSMQTDVWVSSLTPRWRFAIDLAHGDVGETRVDFSGLTRRLSRSDPATVCQQLAESLLGTTLPAEALACMMSLAERDRSTVLPQWVALMLMAPEFQWCA